MKSPRRYLALVVFSLLTLSGACRTGTPGAGSGTVAIRDFQGDELSGDAIRPEADPPREASWRVAGLSHEGRPIRYAVLGSGPLTILVLASIHGNETAGTPLVRELVHRLEEDPPWLAGQRVVVVPLANPDGAQAGGRHNARGVDLNRNFPSSNWQEVRRFGREPLSEPETRVLVELVERYAPGRIVSLHQPASLIDYDGPARDLAEAMAAAAGLPVHPMGARPGSLGSWAGVDRGIPTVTVELPRPADDLSARDLWERYGGALLAACRYADQGEPGSED